MAHQDKVSILITFIIGIIAGGYLYLTGFATTFKLPEVTTDDVYEEFVIIGESYGACSQTGDCFSFQLLENGKYRALYNDRTEDTIVKEGSIPFSLRRALKSNLTPTYLTLDSRLTTAPACQIGDVSFNYRFRISRDQVSYVLDTCLTDIDYSGLPWQTLIQLWDHFSQIKI
ncbi:MAG TPA: hypothetical protein PKD95_04295 [Candidatus Paceibacterota bacterium]|nr:hypothetical protein [Candidatus Paceibacterota bacterium]